MASSASSFASTNARPVSGVNPSRHAMPFPPAPKSVRVLSVFDEGTLDSPHMCPDPTGVAQSRHAPWALWLLGITVISALILAAVFWERIWNQLVR